MKQCPYGRGIIAGLVIGIYGWLVGGLVWMKLFGQVTLANAHLWRPMGDPAVTKGLFISYLIIGLFFSLLYSKVINGLCCICCRYTRGVVFGLLLWLVFGFGCGLMWYTLSPIPVDLLYAMWVDKALFLVGGGLLASIIYGETLCGEGMSCETPEKPKAVAKSAKKPAKKKKK